MLAPRKTLWSTPQEAIDQVIDYFPLKVDDCVCDVGCGDGRVLLSWAEAYTEKQLREPTPDTPSSPTFLGIDVDEARIQSAQKRLLKAREEGRIDEGVDVKFVCQNALSNPELLEGVTVLFLYLIPRGLRTLYPLIQNKHMRVATYMAPLSGVKPVHKARVAVSHQPGAEWPLYFYRLNVAGEDR